MKKREEITAPLSHSLNILHILNDGFYASMLLFLPFFVADLGINLTQAGLLGTIMHSLGIVCALPAGYLALRIGGMKVLILSVFLYGLGYIGTGFAPSYLWLFPMFILAGIGFALFHPIAFALVTRLSRPEQRGRNLGNFTAIGDIGKMAISAALTFIIVYIGWRSAAMLYGITAVAAGILLFAFVHKPREQSKVLEEIKMPVRMHELLSSPTFLLAALTSFFDVFSSSSLFVFLPFLLLARGIDPALLGSFTALFFLGNLLGKTVLGRFADRFASSHVVMLSELLMAICIVLLANSTSVIVIITCSVVAGIFTKGTVPVIQMMIAQASEHHGHFEKSFAMTSFLNSIALTVSPVLLGIISDTWGIGVAFYTMACIALLAIPTAFLFQIFFRHFHVVHPVR